MVMAPAKTMVVDCDTHFWAAPDLWDRVPSALRDRVQAGLERQTYQMHQVVKEKAPAYFSVRGGLDPVERLTWMDEEGIYANIIYPSGTNASMIDDPDAAAAGCRAVNEWSAEFARVNPQRFKPCLILPVRYPNRALEELRHAVKLGLEVAFATPVPMGRRWSDAAFDPVWAEMAENHVVMTFHEFSRASEGGTGRPEYRDSYPMMYLCGHVVELMLTAMDVILGGVLERHPRLRVGFVEGHVAWAPGWLALMDDSFPRTSTFFAEKTGTGTMSLKPSEFFRRQMFVVGFPDDTWVPEYIRHLGSDTLVMSTDYPHPQTRYGLLRQLDENLPDLPEGVRRQILGDNAKRIFRLTW
jgi:predicted TIM-barrel fold metal-dependent hydrolase